MKGTVGLLAVVVLVIIGYLGIVNKKMVVGVAVGLREEMVALGKKIERRIVEMSKDTERERVEKRLEANLKSIEDKLDKLETMGRLEAPEAPERREVKERGRGKGFGLGLGIPSQLQGLGELQRQFHPLKSQSHNAASHSHGTTERFVLPLNLDSLLMDSLITKKDRAVERGGEKMFFGNAGTEAEGGPVGSVGSAGSIRPSTSNARAKAKGRGHNPHTSPLLHPHPHPHPDPPYREKSIIDLTEKGKSDHQESLTFRAEDTPLEEEKEIINLREDYLVKEKTGTPTITDTPNTISHVPSNNDIVSKELGSDEPLNQAV